MNADKPADIGLKKTKAANEAHAATALACLDLTSLNDDDTEADIAALCERAVTAHGAVAAVCVWPRFAAFARAELPRHVAVAAVANFPAGRADVMRAVRDVQAIVQAGAQEVDVVLPWRHLHDGDDASCARFLAAVRRACAGLRLKVILETGELRSRALITRACRVALDAGADFLKTSTGKTATSATPQAAYAMLQAISLHGDPRVGFKASGGIRTVAQAGAYIEMTRTALGDAALAPSRFRLGASSLLNDIEAVLEGRDNAAPASRY